MTQTYAPRPRRWWIALILNALFPPVGYAYAGAWKMVVVTVVGVMAGAVALNEWTLASPPGIYADGLNGLLVGAAVLAAVFGLHAAWLAGRAPPRGGRPSKLALLYIAPWALLFVANMLFGAYGPHPTYNITSAALEPTLKPGDIVMVEGARANCGRGDMKVGDVVVFRRPGDAAPYMHRIVAGPGQTVAMTDGLLAIDGTPLARRPMGSVAMPSTPLRVTEFEETLANGVRHRIYDFGPNGAHDQVRATTLAPGSWYLMGDNRDDAVDSRSFGPVPGSDICAVALKIVYAKDKSRVGRRP
ncbi:MAG: signal peptidase I [Alphaproteobacteria bacterium]|nr:signal peptidase I [Alphaproteobacteria bacterium]MBU1514875.1 signal peptidase I [Alphaproteobacteria bacterium]MBU2093796.1 signal peptidase I [Alphaproteobacteria bacterium]MBU2149417.1 signal peptidase I [Alphaproteobacteria bacterium]MBU2305377.1 signal peptidase I [Alphaproteobacteria bacterium]